MTEGCFLQASDHRVRLKWHRAQRRKSDVPFTLARLKEGFALGASMEVDLRLSADRELICLHDATLDRETTGEGPVNAASLEELRRLRLRLPDGTPSDQPVLLLEDLAALAAGGHTNARLQLDLKDRLPLVDETAAACLGKALHVGAARFTLSGQDWNAVKLLGAAAPALQLGYDPCDRPEVAGLSTARDFTAFVTLTLETAPEATIIYMHHRIVLAGLQKSFDMIAAFHAAGREVDAWTMAIDQADLSRDLKQLVDARVDQITTGDPIAFEALWEVVSPKA